MAIGLFRGLDCSPITDHLSLLIEVRG